jgi:hypothetical protein
VVFVIAILVAFVAVAAVDAKELEIARELEIAKDALVANDDVVANEAVVENDDVVVNTFVVALNVNAFESTSTVLLLVVPSANIT